MTTTEILNSNKTKTRKMQLLFEAGFSRKEVATMIGCGYGFVQNVYAKTYPDRIQSKNFRLPTFERKFGIEIECFGTTKRKAKNAIQRKGINIESEYYNHNTRNYWKIVNDASISGQGESFEVVSPILIGTEGLRQLKLVCEALEECGAKVNKSCGVHVHFDANNMQIADFKNLFKNYARSEKIIDSFMPNSRRGNNNTYCKSLLQKHRTLTKTESMIDTCNTVTDIDTVINNGNRYKKVNLKSYFRHGTVEFRQHSGTIEYTKISNWVLFLHSLVAYSQKGKLVDKNNPLASIKKITKNENYTYLTNRIAALAA